MRWFYIKTNLIVIAFSVVMFLFTVFVLLRPLLLKSEWQNFQEELVVDHQLLMIALDGKETARYAQIVDRYNPVFAMVPEIISLQDLEEVERQTLRQTRRYLSDIDEELWYGLFALPNSNAVLQISEDDESSVNFGIDEIVFFILPLLLIAVSQALGTLLIIRSISKPVLHLSKVAAAFGGGDLNARIVDSKPLVQPIADSFNSMANQLQRKVQEQQIMLGAIAHELRTPLSKVRFALDLSRSKKDVGALQNQIEQVDQYVDDIENITEDVLELVSLNQDQPLNKTAISIRSLISEVQERLQSDKHIAVDNNVDEALRVYANEALIRLAITNVLKNALQYANGRVIIDAQLQAGDVLIGVKDDGEGVPPEKLKEIFLLFSRIDESRGRATGGLGLGLAITKLIMEKHSGEVDAQNTQPSGLLVELSWPNLASELDNEKLS